jgi:hypothetical protein
MEHAMPRRFVDSLALTRRVLSGLIGLNLLMGVLILLLLIASLVAETLVMTGLGARPTGSNGAQIVGMRVIMLVGIGVVPLAHVVLTRLRTIVDTVKVGDPFLPENAARLRVIAWSVLGIELLHVVVGIVVMIASSAAEPIGVNWTFSATRWIAVLLLFVLARVFTEGARMREDLEGTV